MGHEGRQDSLYCTCQRLRRVRRIAHAMPCELHGGKWERRTCEQDDTERVVASNAEVNEGGAAHQSVHPEILSPCTNGEARAATRACLVGSGALASWEAIIKELPPLRSLQLLAAEALGPLGAAAAAAAAAAAVTSHSRR